MDMYIYEYVNIRIYFYICNYWCLWMCMYMDMYMYMIPFAEHWSVRCTARSNSWSLKFAFRHNFTRSTHRILREGSSNRMKMCVSLQRRACKSMEMYVSLQWRVQNVWGMGGGGGDHTMGGGGNTGHGTIYMIYMCIYVNICIWVCVSISCCACVYIYLCIYGDHKCKALADWNKPS